MQSSFGIAPQLGRTTRRYASAKTPKFADRVGQIAIDDHVL
ncbi:hypothetical protein AB0L13_15820 [Saccharopolyspora shandongensis]